MPQHGHKMTVFIWIGKMRQSPKMAKSWKSKGQSLGAAIKPGYLPQMFGRVRWLGWNLRVQWLPFSWYAGGWNGIWQRFLQTACCNVMQCLEGIKAIAPGSKLQHCTCRYKVSFQEKGTSRWEQPPKECPPSLLTMRCKSRKRVEPRAGALDHDVI